MSLDLEGVFLLFHPNYNQVFGLGWKTKPLYLFGSVRYDNDHAPYI